MVIHFIKYNHRLDEKRTQIKIPSKWIYSLLKSETLLTENAPITPRCGTQWSDNKGGNWNDPSIFLLLFIAFYRSISVSASVSVSLLLPDRCLLKCYNSICYLYWMKRDPKGILLKPYTISFRPSWIKFNLVGLSICSFEQQFY